MSNLTLAVRIELVIAILPHKEHGIPGGIPRGIPNKMTGYFLQTQYEEWIVRLYWRLLPTLSAALPTSHDKIFFLRVDGKPVYTKHVLPSTLWKKTKIFISFRYFVSRFSTTRINHKTSENGFIFEIHSQKNNIQLCFRNHNPAPVQMYRHTQC